jgi:hypothetical protein
MSITSPDETPPGGFQRTAFLVETGLQVVTLCALAALLTFVFLARDFIAPGESLELVRSRGVKVGFFLFIPVVAAFAVTGLRRGFGGLSRDRLMSGASTQAAKYIWLLSVAITLILAAVAGFAALTGFGDIDFKA